MNLPPLSALRSFEATARLGSLSAAGRELNVTHAAVAQQIKRLEDWFGLPLLIREGRGMVTTPDGAMLAEGLETGFGAIRGAVARVAEAEAERPLRISTTPSLASNWLIPRLGDFRAANPDIDLVIDPTTRVIDMAARDVDIGLRFGMGTWPGVESRLLFSSDLVVAAGAALIGDRQVTSLRDLIDLPWVQERGTDEWRVWLQSQGLEDLHRRSVTHMPANLTIDAIRRGQAVGIAPRAWVCDDIEAGSVLALFEREAPDALGYYAVTLPGIQRPPVKAFIDWCIEASATTGKGHPRS